MKIRSLFRLTVTILAALVGIWLFAYSFWPAPKSPPIIEAVWASDYEQLQSLIEQGAPLDAVQPERAESRKGAEWYGYTALHLAVVRQQDDPKYAAALLEAGADVTVVDSFGHTPSDTLCKNFGIYDDRATAREILRMLIETGIDPVHMDRQGAYAMVELASIREVMGLEMLIKLPFSSEALSDALTHCVTGGLDEAVAIICRRLSPEVLRTIRETVEQQHPRAYKEGIAALEACLEERQ
jgi:hypothetical protein